MKTNYITKSSDNFLQNGINFIKIYPVVAEIWHCKLCGTTHFWQKLEISKVNIFQTTSQISMKFEIFVFYAQPICRPNRQIGDGSVKKWKIFG